MYRNQSIETSIIGSSFIIEIPNFRNWRFAIALGAVHHRNFEFPQLALRHRVGSCSSSKSRISAIGASPSRWELFVLLLLLLLLYQKHVSPWHWRNVGSVGRVFFQPAFDHERRVPEFANLIFLVE